MKESVTNAPFVQPAGVEAALRAIPASALGDVLMAAPLPFYVLSIAASVAAALVILFLIFATYTRRTTVTGQIVPDAGLVKVFSPQSGVVTERRVTDGASVIKDQVLYILSSERQSTTKGQTQASISKEVQDRQRDMEGEVKKLQLMEAQDVSADQAKIAGQVAAIHSLESQIGQQTRRVAVSEELERRTVELANGGFVSRDQLNERQADRIDQESRLESLNRDKITAGLQLNADREDLRQLPLKYANQISELQRSVVSAEQELDESEARRELVITAPSAGVATAVVGDVGQVWDVSKPLVSIIPAGAHMQAHLYAPSKSVGFVKSGDLVHLRFDAFPYQKFGLFSGRVQEVSDVALSSAELTGSDAFAQTAPDGSKPPIYRIVVALDAQTVLAYGQRRPLQPGMIVDADILQESRRLYEWLAEPLFSLSGHL